MGLAIGLYYLLWVIGLQYYIAIDEFGLVSQKFEAILQWMHSIRFDKICQIIRKKIVKKSSKKFIKKFVKKFVKKKFIKKIDEFGLVSRKFEAILQWMHSIRFDATVEL